MDLVMTALAQRHEIKKNGTYFVAFTLNTATTTYYGITRLTSSTSSTSTALAATASAVKAAYDRNSWDSISLTNALAVAYGGTGATTAAGARANLGIGITQLYFGTLTTGGTSFNYGNYNFYIILGQPWSSGSLTPIVVPKIALTSHAVFAARYFNSFDPTFYIDKSVLIDSSYVPSVNPSDFILILGDYTHGIFIVSEIT